MNNDTIPLPLDPTRKESEGTVVGRCAQAFNITNDEGGKYVGYVMGTLCLPPNGIKDPESSQGCSLLFTVCQALNQPVELALSDPRYDEFDEKTAQILSLGPGDQFRVPPGNWYRLQNLSKTTNALISWVIIRPCLPREDEESCSS